MYGNGTLGSTLRPPPHAERDHEGDRERKPGDGVLQMVVLEMDGERAGLRDAAIRRRCFQIDVERGDALTAFVSAKRARHREMIAREPEPFREIGRAHV